MTSPTESAASGLSWNPGAANDPDRLIAALYGNRLDYAPRAAGSTSGRRHSTPRHDRRAAGDERGADQLGVARSLADHPRQDRREQHARVAQREHEARAAARERFHQDQER